MGAPEGLELTLSEGLISGFRPTLQGKLIQTTTPISHGSSGAGLFDAEGRLVGITVGSLEQGQNLNFAVPADLIVGIERRLVPVAAAQASTAPQRPGNGGGNTHPPNAEVFDLPAEFDRVNFGDDTIYISPGRVELRRVGKTGAYDPEQSFIASCGEIEQFWSAGMGNVFDIEFRTKQGDLAFVARDAAQLNSILRALSRACPGKTRR